ncbi:acyl-CoA carboxylase subunit epsilon [Microbacterium sulfonylureivorans]|uniref:acyl-CoA carboxylase subunit epsilon n=1 Tax=Microbacterium sulfonylureivorans TaxID=2486854 RepID=UPI000FDAF182|nr:acyl-CoA carboxylase subunit epsilon [Microbacterium sulfonylureivorans]
MSPGDDTGEGVTIDVLRGTPTEDELAALIAVVSEAYVGEAAEAVADDETARTAWSITQRSLRTPLRRELGWGRFSG